MTASPPYLWYRLYHGTITLDDLRVALAKSQ